MNSLYPIQYSEAVTPHDTNTFDNCRALIVGTAGNVKVTYVNGKEDTVYLAAGDWHFMEVKRVYSTGTTAANISAGY